ncbi:MAG: LysR substrate-binding domain-containing protein [Planktomarina sp.]|nr:LysR substrate-binding domain-containing protein [Planktomarina sp.]MDT2050509.1 LysR substrate-binding domain-containing protein [Planktomarina sp.]|tara:strand:+ start:436 stop:1329 length:894 start_codon:yes stop_codon:yes gene_type:complete
MYRFSLRQLEYFVACVDHGSTARAAGALNVSQPTISIAVNKLESELGVQLLRRHHSQGVTATANAESILHSARALLAHATDLQSQIMTKGDTISGELKLGSFSTLASSILPRLINSFSSKHPEIQLKITEGTQVELLEGLNSGQLEMALLYDLDLPASIERTKLTALTPHAVLPPGHPLSTQADVDIADLAGEPFILLDVPPSREYFLGLFRSVGLEPNILHSSPSLELVRGLVGYGLGFSLLVTRPASDMTYDGQQLSIRPLRNKFTKSSIVLAHHKDLRPTQLMTLFSNLAQSIM